MSDTAIVTSPAPVKRKRRKQKEAWTRKAQRHGVCTRTLDRWVEQGIIDPPIRVRGRKYGNADEEPRAD
jgi:hypothetical protein